MSNFKLRQRSSSQERCAWCHASLNEELSGICKGCGCKIHVTCLKETSPTLSCVTLGCNGNSPSINQDLAETRDDWIVASRLDRFVKPWNLGQADPRLGIRCAIICAIAGGLIDVVLGNVNGPWAIPLFILSGAMWFGCGYSGIYLLHTWLRGPTRPIESSQVKA